MTTGATGEEDTFESLLTEQSPNELLAAALTYARRGYALFPCKPRGKAPLTSHGVDDATRDEKQIRAWWERWPTANIGVALGPSGVMAIDADPKYGADPIRVGEELGLGEPTVSTGVAPEPSAKLPKSLAGVRGGHWLTRGDMRGYPRTNLEGVELRGRGMYLIAPGSEHETGVRYEGTYPPVEELAPMPDSVLAILLDGTRSDGHGGGGSFQHMTLKELEQYRPVNGERSNYLITVGGRYARKSASWESCEAKIRDANNCLADPLADDELRTTVLVSSRRYFNAAQEEKQHAAEEIHRGARHEYTDAGNARRFMEDHQGWLVYADGPGWFAWNGKLWRPLGKDEELKYAEVTARRIRKEVAGITDDRAAEKCLKWAGQSASASRLDAMARLGAAGDLDAPDLRVDVHDLDRDPEILNTPSGPADLRSGEPYQGSPKALLCTKCTAVPYAPDADMTGWEEVLEQLLPDGEVRATLKRHLGASVTGYPSKALGVFYGASGDNGKTLVIETISGVLGSYAGTAMENTLTSARASEAAYDLAELRGKRFVSASETAEGRGLATERVKRLTGFDSLTARSPYKRPFTFTVTFNLFIGTNHTPVIGGGEKAMWNRLWVYPFDQVIAKSKQIENYATVLVREHGPGILRWLVEGAQEFLAADRKLGPQPAAMEAQRQTWKRRDDLVLRWVEARTEPNLHSSVRFPDAFADFQIWLDLEGESAALKMYTSQKFHAELDAYYDRSAKPSNGAYKRLGMRLMKGHL